MKIKDLEHQFEALSQEELQGIVGGSENLFYAAGEIKSMAQTEGDQYCREKFEQLKNSGYFPVDPNLVNHVWAHIRNGQCIANTPDTYVIR